MSRAVVIGGGITGVLTAHALLTEGWEVDLVEGRHLGAGSSSRTAAGIRQQFTTPGTVRGMRYSRRAYMALSEEFGARTMTSQGYLFLLPPGGRAAAEARVAMQREAGLAEVELLDRVGLADRFPMVDADEVEGATWCPTDGFLHPEVIVQEGARRVRELGGRVLTTAPVVGARVVSGRLRALRTPAGPVEGDVFLDCTNAWTDQLAPLLGARVLPVAPVKRYLWFVKRHGLAAEALSSWPMIVSPTGVYGRPENPDLLLLGWATPEVPEPDFSMEDQDRVDSLHAHDGGLDALPFQAWAHMAEVVPALGDFDGVVATTAGFYGVTPDHNPFLGHDPDVAGLIRLVGFSGHGAMFGPFSAAVGAALAAAGRDLDEIVLPTGVVALDAFGIGRVLAEGEGMVL